MRSLGGKFYCFTDLYLQSRTFGTRLIKASIMFANASVDLYLRNDIFQRAHSLVQRQKRGEVEMEPELAQFLRNFYLQFIQTGCGLPEGPERDAFREKL